MSQIHFIGGEKGGVGKSVLTRLLAQYHIDRDLPFQAFDTDRSHGAMLRFYGNYTRPIILDDFSSADQLMEAAMECHQNVLVDMAAQTSLPLFKWMDDYDLLQLAAEEGIGVVLWHVLDDGVDSIDLLERLFGHYAENAEYVVVKNRGRGNDFSPFEASSARATAYALDVPVIELPGLHGQGYTIAGRGYRHHATTWLMIRGDCDTGSFRPNRGYCIKELAKDLSKVPTHHSAWPNGSAPTRCVAAASS